MVAPNEPENEYERLKNLESYNIIDTLPEVDYDNITAIAAQICDTPISLVTLIDDKRQWFKSHHGVDASETPKEYAFCAHAINTPNEVFIIQDARIDNRFHDNPLVQGDTQVVFYAGVPLVSKNGLSLGTLCVIDHKPNLLSPGQIKSLTALSNQVMNLLELRKNKLLLEQTLKNLEEKNEALERFAFIAAHDLKSPLFNISSLAELFLEDYGLKIDNEGQEILKAIISSSDSLNSLIDGLLSYSRSENILREEKLYIDVETLKNDASGFFVSDYNLKITLKSTIDSIFVNQTAINQILINLFTNAIKYNDKDIVEIQLGVSENDTHYEFYVQDNGLGIPVNFQDKIFNIFEKSGFDKFGNPGNGIGLATVKKIVEKSGGAITVGSELGKGSKFIFTLKK
ncbi:histidine kinase [Pseudalgibacter alginicilyticus]|uniref:histidine kinase n=1 Tax=Pseudalgibacter alginicilyticus TaxID=1736674 RepID=A0A0P0D4Y6_9FLAO|nr:ATP-binding protein [Pseudalgibacter alginicilyticus]ALJ05987.1 histidine kinase [Pseudalgibacter alginicilyticus]